MNKKLVIFLIVFIDLFGFGIMIPMLPFYARSFGASATEVGALMFVYSLMQTFVAPLWGRLSDRFGRKPILLFTIGGQAVAFLWGGLAFSYGMLLMSRILAGFFAANISTASAYMADVTKPEERARGMGLIGAAFGLGFIFGPAVGGVLVAESLAYPSLFAAVLCLANLILAYFILEEPLKSLESREKSRSRTSLFDLMEYRSPALWYPIILVFLLTFAFVQMEITFGLFVVDRFGFSARQAGYLLAIMGVMMAVVQGGLIGRLTKKFDEMNLILCGMASIVMGLVLIVYVENLSKLLVALGCIAVGYSLTNPCLSALASKAAPRERQGASLGLYQSGASMARVLAPLTAGYLYDQRIDFPFFVAAGVVTLAFFVGGFRFLKWRSVG